MFGIEKKTFYKMVFFVIFILVLYNLIKTDIFTVLNINSNRCVKVKIDKINKIWGEINKITKKYGMKTGGISHVPDKANSIIDYFRNKNINKMAEIGFNAGHSTSLFLILFPNCRITIFDLMMYPYSEECKSFLQKEFPNRIKVIKGDSIKKIPNYFKKDFDLVHIDGNHDGEYPKLDLENSIKFLLNKKGYIIFDDSRYNNSIYLNNKFKNCINILNTFIKNNNNVKLLKKLNGSSILCLME